MDWLTFFARVIEALAWPLFAGFALIVFRHLLRMMLARLGKFRWSSEGGLQISFLDKELEEVSAEANAAGLPVAGPNIYRLAPPDPFINIVQTFPELGIIQSWNEIEQSLREVARSLGVDGADRRRSSELLSTLRERHMIDDQAFSLINKLRVIRNDVVHGRTERPPTSGQALEFYNLSHALLKRLRDSTKRTS